MATVPRWPVAAGVTLLTAAGLVAGILIELMTP